MQPSSGPQFGNTRIILTGSGFENEEETLCRFASAFDGGYLVKAQWLSATSMLCFTPSVVVSGAADLEVTNNGVDFSTSGFHFLFRPTESISFIVPSIGPSSGGFYVTVVGSNFFMSDALTCQFGEIIVPAVYYNESCLNCLVPATTPGLSFIAVSNNMFDFSDSVNFEYYQPMIVSEIRPSEVSVFGSSLVTLFGQSVSVASVAPLCRFREHVTSGSLSKTSCATYDGSVCLRQSASHIVCPIPNLAAGIVPVDISLDQFIFAFTGFYLQVRDTIRISAIFPTHGPNTGGSLVTIVPLFGAASILRRCKFGDQSGLVKDQSTPLLVCSVPPCKNLCVGSVQVWAGSSLNGDDWSHPQDQIFFSYFSDYAALSIWPSEGPYLGKTSITVFGSFFEGAGYKCTFGDVSVSATLVDSSTIICLSPQGDEGNVRFSLHVLPAQIPANLTFYYTAPIIISRIVPSHGPVEGGTTVVLIGSNFYFASNLTCLFDASKSAATFISSSKIQCLSLKQNSPVRVQLMFTNNGLDVFGNDFYFTFWNPLVIHDTFPDRGPLNGGTVINFVGANFFDSVDMVCTFFFQTPIKIIAYWSSPTSAYCVAPMSVPGKWAWPAAAS